LIAPSADPPVCRIADIGKLKYESQKREKEARKSQRGGVLKELKISPKIAQHDFEVRVNSARGFLEKKNKIKVVMYFRGREGMYINLGIKVLDKLIEAIADLGKPEAPPKKFGKSLIMIIVPK
jgi:translation initiation factor IF-3